MNAFFCATPYQVMIAIHMTLYKGEKSDLFILNHFHSAYNVAQKLNNLGLFRKVEVIQSYEFTKSFSSNQLYRFKQKIQTYLNYKRIVNDYLKIDNIHYDHIYLSFPDIIIQLAIKYIHSMNPLVKVHLFEDGTGGYNDKLLQISKYKKMFNKLVGYNRIIDRYDSILLFEPSLYTGHTSIPLRAIKKIEKDNIKLKNIFNTIFDYDKRDSIEQKFIFLEQPYEFADLNFSIKDSIKEIFNSDLIVKLHPRSISNDLYADFSIYKNIKLPWEVISLNHQIESKVLISYYSTACFTNKIIFDQEPYIIFLFNLQELPNKKILTNKEFNFINKLKSKYTNKERIIIPDNIEELKQILGSLNL